MSSREPLDRAAMKTSLDRIFYLFLEKSPDEVRRALAREPLLQHCHRMLGRKAFLALVDELAPSLGAERLHRYLAELAEASKKKRPRP